MQVQQTDPWVAAVVTVEEVLHANQVLYHALVNTWQMLPSVSMQSDGITAFFSGAGP